MGRNAAEVSRPSLGWPSPEDWGQARIAFDAAFAAFESEVNDQLQSAANVSEAEVAPEVDQMEIWKRAGRGGAPSRVRENGWLLLAWGLWCVKKEEPALVWIGWGAALLMIITAAYPFVRWAVALALRAGGT